MARSERLLRRSRSLRPTVRGIAFAAFGVLCVFLAYSTGWAELLVLAAAALLFPIVGFALVALGRQKLDVVRVFSPTAVSAGESVRVSIAVRNRGQRATLPGAWNDSLPWWEPASPHPLPSLAPSSVPLDAVLPEGRERSPVFSYELHTAVRGVYPVGPLAVEIGDPFGMARSVTAQGSVDQLIVVPDAVKLPGGALSTAEAEGSALLVHRRVMGNDDDLTTREYRSGDALRRVHWRASARHGELMVRQEEQRSFPEARVVVDTRRDGYPDAEAAPYGDVPAVESYAFEWVVRMLASLGVHLSDGGFRVSLRETAHAQIADFGERWESGRPEEPFLVSLASTALVEEPEGSSPKSPPGGSGPVFAILGSPSEPVLRWLLRQRRPGEAAVAFLSGPDTDGAVATLHDAGWVVVPVQGDVDPAEAWSAAHLGWGAIRGTH